MASTITKLTTLAVLMLLPAASAAGLADGDPPSSNDPGATDSGGGSSGGSTDGGDAGSSGGSTDGGEGFNLGLGGLALPGDERDGLIPDTPSVGEVWDDVGVLAGEVLGALPCDQAVRVERDWYAAHVRDTRTGTDAWRQRDYFPIKHYRQVEVTPDLPAPGAAVEGALGTIGVEIGRATGSDPAAPRVYRTEAYDVWTSVPVTVQVDWMQKYYHWVHHHDSFLVALAAGSAFLASGEGELVEACDPDTPIVSYVPDPSARGAVATCWKLCRWAPDDRWVTVDYAVNAWLTTPADMSLPFEGSYRHRCHYWSCSAIADFVRGLSPTLAQLLFQQGQLAGLDLGDAPEPTADEATVEPQGVAVASFPLGAVLAAIAAVVAAAGAGTYAYLRRK